jgi:thioredoxin 1
MKSKSHGLSPYHAQQSRSRQVNKLGLDFRLISQHTERDDVAMNECSEQSQAFTPVRYEIDITAEEATLGTKKILSRHGKKLEVSIPAGVKAGTTVKLANALQVTDGHPGDILIQVEVKEEQIARGVIEISDDRFEGEVLKCSSPVMVDFWAPWCGPCRMVAPVTEKLAEEYEGRLKFCKLNVDENPQTASKYQVMSIPQILFFKDGEVVDESTGAVPESVLRSKVESVLQRQ